ncbi:MAG: serine/threonine-protein kinase, partial [Myxococcota bacterium]
MTLSIGDLLEGKYRIERVLGEGGMGTVYEAKHRVIHRRVAVKVLRGAMLSNPEMVERFEREALAVSSIRSRHVVEVFDVGRLASGENYMILEYLEGENLAERLEGGRTMAPGQILPLVAQLLDGLEAAHSAGVIHRDLKPANVFLAVVDGREMVKILDFGVSKLAALSQDEFTRAGSIVGTPHYLAPELTKGARHADPRSDLYATGAILFRVVTGRPPFDGETVHELLSKLVHDDAPKLHSVAPHTDPEVAQICDRALAKDPTERFGDAREMAEAILSYLETVGSEETMVASPRLSFPVPPPPPSSPTTHMVATPAESEAQTRPSLPA